MANPWFRLYAEFANDPKVQMLSEVNQRRLVMLFCFRCNGDVTLQDEEVTFQLRVTDDEWLSTKAIFIAKGFIDNDNKILNWDKRQYVSDSSAERVAKHRDKVKRSSNVTVTPPEQNRTEQNIKNIVQKVAHNNKNWRTSESDMLAMAKELSIGTQGVSKFDLIAKIDAKLR